MKNFTALTQAINYIEANISNVVTKEDIANFCYVSVSSLEKIFRYALNLSIGDYITRRKMTLAARDLAKNDCNVLELAMKYGYNSPEVFARAFKRVWSINPSEFLKNWKFTGLFPKINFNYKEGEDLYMARKNVDISEAYDFFREKEGSYVICFDVKGLLTINEISRKAGDLVILEALSRIDKHATEDMHVMRIGGDEFALITCLTDKDEVEKIRRKIMSLNSKTIIFENKEIPVALWSGIANIPKALRYSDFFSELHKVVIKD